MWIQCAPRSNGTPKVVVSVMQRPPMRSARLDQRKPPLGRRNPPRRRDAGGAGADDHHVDVAGGGNRA